MTANKKPSGLLRHACPEHGHALVNVHKIREGQRVVIGQVCPEPHCQYAEMSPRALDATHTLGTPDTVERTAV